MQSFQPATSPPGAPGDDWHRLPADLQLTIAREAMRVAIATVAGQADLLAGEITAGSLIDQGGPDALRLLANVLRQSVNDPVAAPHWTSRQMSGHA